MSSLNESKTASASFNLVDKLSGALWGFFIADSLSMPADWFYNPDNIIKVFGPNGITGYIDCPPTHVEAFMAGSQYNPAEISTPNYRPADILHQHSKYYNIHNSEYDGRSFKQSNVAENDSHGNAFATASDSRPHYHVGLKAGENTLQGEIIRLFLKTSVENNGYNQNQWLKSFTNYMLSAREDCVDPYIEIAIRKYFENYSRGLPLYSCAVRQRDTWSTGNCCAMASTIITSLLYPHFLQRGIARVFEHQALLYRSEQAMVYGTVLIPLIHRFIHSESPSLQYYFDSLLTVCESIYSAKLSGPELSAKYREYKGPDNIPKDETWQLHNQLREEAIRKEIETFLNSKDSIRDVEVLPGRYDTACYIEQGIPGIIYLALKYNFNLEAALLANANVGGDTTGRGAILGLIIGSAIGKSNIPEHLIRGLKNCERLNREISEFVELAVKGGLKD
ncbi:unnamed protein product [Didymodactylos carnosus]|uniref:ADP-ribosylglycohydrolase n=1 Tax=Didymodactylos carnosus TaxID=1234261 RepID=A0A814YSK2_9BILA|nr:unnamed protein product [Didymodactylos carnosus]CAF1235072.1 unnamed protein product [Didymodactylos carnosus]CAF3677656.1 unnamed protein product [Didymodactylos carnosus]CAF3997473.1 unnamed protein product [Didymodactylos carnosus]